jgi:hypothetical protein
MKYRVFAASDPASDRGVAHIHVLSHDSHDHPQALLAAQQHCDAMDRGELKGLLRQVKFRTTTVLCDGEPVGSFVMFSDLDGNPVVKSSYVLYSDLEQETAYATQLISLRRRL